MAFLLPNSVFIHVPKTGGQWVAKALGKLGLITGAAGAIHASPDEIDAIDTFRKMEFRFTFVRHPLTWYQSIWSHRMDEQWETIDDPDWFSERWISHWAELTDRCQSDCFTEFVENCLHRFPQGFISNLFDVYSQGCSFIGKQETLEGDLISALEMAGEVFDKNLLAQTRPKNIRGRQLKRRQQTSYTQGLVQRVMKVENWAVNRFAYHEIPSHVIQQLDANGR